jgi:hypothetical protein
MRLSKSLMNSSRSLDQQGVLMEEDQRCVLIIGGIIIFLPIIQEEVNAQISGATEEIQLTNHVIKKKKE